MILRLPVTVPFILIDIRIYTKNWRRKLLSFMGRRTPFCMQVVSMPTPGCLRCYWGRRMRWYPTNWTTPPSSTEYAFVKLRDCAITTGIWKVGNGDNYAHCVRYIILMSEGCLEKKMFCIRHDNFNFYRFVKVLHTCSLHYIKQMLYLLFFMGAWLIVIKIVWKQLNVLRNN